MSILLNLFIIGAVIFVSLFVFQFVLSLFMAIVSLIVSGVIAIVNWLMHGSKQEDEKVVDNTGAIIMKNIEEQGVDYDK